MLEYGEMTYDDIITNADVQFTFSVDYYMENDISHIIDVGNNKIVRNFRKIS